MANISHAKESSRNPICCTECPCIFYLNTKLDPVLKMLPFKLIRSRVPITTEQAHNPPQTLAQTPLFNLTLKQKTYRHFGALNMGERK